MRTVQSSPNNTGNNPNNTEDAQLTKTTVPLQANAEGRAAQPPSSSRGAAVSVVNRPRKKPGVARMCVMALSQQRRERKNNHATRHLAKITVLLRANDAAVAPTASGVRQSVAVTQDDIRRSTCGQLHYNHGCGNNLH